MSVRAVAVSAVLCAVLVVLGRWIFELDWENALVLAPLFVLCAGGIAFLVLLWAKVIHDSLRGREKP